MIFSLLSPRRGLHLGLALGLTAWASFGQPAAAQDLPRPTAEVLRAQRKAVATPVSKAPAKAPAKPARKLEITKARTL